MIIPIGYRVRGRTRWTLLDEHGNVEKQGPWASNLITNHGLDQLLQTIYFEPYTGMWRDYMAVGTGSTEPSFSDISLDAEVGATDSNGNFPQSSTQAINGDVVTATLSFTRVWTANADRNITEYGFKVTNSGDLTIRELFRDDLGDPVTLTILNGKKLRVDHEHVIEFDRVVPVSFDLEEFDAQGVSLGTTTKTGTLYLLRGTDASDIQYAVSPFQGVISSTYAWPDSLIITSRPTIGWANNISEYYSSAAGDVINFNGATVLAYTSGTYYRDIRARFDESDGNGDFTMFGVCDWSNYGAAVVLDDPQVISKTSEQRLDVFFRWTVSRAGGS